MKRATRKNRKNIAASTLLLWIAVAGVAPAESGIVEGIAWLASSQEPSGLWGTPGGIPLRDAAVVVGTLSSLNADPSGVAAGRSALAVSGLSSTDFLARRILANVPGGGVDLTGWSAALAGRQNTDGGWGYTKGYGSNILETALALEALKKAGYANTSLYSIGLGYLTSRQNADRGWGFGAGDSSRVFYTAHTLFALEALRNDFVLTTPIQNAINWLKTQDHSGGGFGTGPVSNPYETGLGILALLPVDSLALEVSQGRNYLLSTQRTDGSWNGNSYRTALAVLALRGTGTAGVEPIEVPAELRFSVSPNPARNTSVVSLAMPLAGHVQLAIYDVTGRRVKTLANGELAAGTHRWAWGMRSDGGVPLSSGAYYLRLTLSDRTLTKRMVLTR